MKEGGSELLKAENPGKRECGLPRGEGLGSEEEACFERRSLSCGNFILPGLLGSVGHKEGLIG